MSFGLPTRWALRARPPNTSKPENSTEPSEAGFFRFLTTGHEDPLKQKEENRKIGQPSQATANPCCLKVRGSSEVGIEVTNTSRLLDTHVPSCKPPHMNLRANPPPPLGPPSSAEQRGREVVRRSFRKQGRPERLFGKTQGSRFAFLFLFFRMICFFFFYLFKGFGRRSVRAI